MKSNLIIILFCVWTINSYSKTDSAKKQFDHTYWTPRYSIGMQKSPFVEIGFSSVGQGGDYGSWCFYSAIDINYRNTTFSNSKLYYGLKFGYETSWVFLMWALEFKYSTNFDNSQMIFFTPKVGISIGGFFNLLYGYNLPNVYSELPGIGHHQISLIANINRKIIKNEFKTNNP